MRAGSVDELVRNLIDNSTRLLIDHGRSRIKYGAFIAGVEGLISSYKDRVKPGKNDGKEERERIVEYLADLTDGLKRYPDGNEGIIRDLMMEGFKEKDAKDSVEIAKQYIEFIAKVKELMIYGNGHREHAQEMYNALKDKKYLLDVVIQKYNEPLINDNPNRYKAFLVGVDDYRAIRGQHNHGDGTVHYSLPDKRGMRQAG